MSQPAPDPDQQFQVVEPQPTPETWVTDILQSATGNMVAVVIHSVTGKHVSFITPDNAISLGESIANAGRQAKSGLVVPPAGLILPPAQPNGHHKPA